MSAIAEAPFDAAAGDRLARRNALVLAIGVALGGANNTVLIATGAILGAMLAPDKSLATLPISFMVLGMWAGTLPVGYLARRLGRRTTYQIGAGCGVLAGLVGHLAILTASFAIFLGASFLVGLYAASHMSYRFAAADTASAGFKPKAVAWVMAGGLLAAFIGPQLVIHTKDLMPPYLFAVSYLGQAGVGLLAIAVLALVRVPPVAEIHREGAGRPLAEVARQPRFIVAVVCGVASYGLMNLMMTAAPLAMVDCGLSVGDATLGIQWHVLAMYAPSFITGSLIVRLGVERVVMLGFVILMASAAVGLAGLTVAHFWSALILLGVGWNFSLIGATTMVTECHRPEERNRVQAFNDFLIFGVMAVGSFASGTMLAAVGWALVAGIMVPIAAAALLLALWLERRGRPQPA